MLKPRAWLPIYSGAPEIAFLRRKVPDIRTNFPRSQVELGNIFPFPSVLHFGAISLKNRKSLIYI
jgi:hypothetical protein